MKLVCHIGDLEGLFDIVQGATFSEDYNETLDSGNIIIVSRNRQLNIKPYDDVIIFGAEPYGGEHDEIHLTEMVLREDNPWVGKKIRELDISRHSIIILIKRKNKVRIPSKAARSSLIEGTRRSF